MLEGEGNPMEAAGTLPERRARPPIPKRAWGEPLARFDRAWTRLESGLAAWVLLAEIVALCLWVALKGLSAEYQTAGSGDRNVSGLVFRSLLTAVGLGLAAHFLTRPDPRGGQGAEKGARAEERHRVAVTFSVFAGLLLGRLWANAGVE